MKRSIILAILIVITVISCKNNKQEKVSTEKIKNSENLIMIEDEKVLEETNNKISKDPVKVKTFTEEDRYFTLDGAYTDIITIGDGDFLTENTVWDFKVSKHDPNKDHTLQLLIYYIMGKKSNNPEFKTVRNLGIFNPRLNKVYLLAISDVPTEVIAEVSEEIIGYK